MGVQQALVEEWWMCIEIFDAFAFLESTPDVSEAPKRDTPEIGEALLTPRRKSLGWCDSCKDRALARIIQGQM